MKKTASLFIILIGLFLLSNNSGAQQPKSIPPELRPYLNTIHFGQLNKQDPDVQYTAIPGVGIHVLLTWNIMDSVQQDDLQVKIFPAFKPTFHWSPHLTPTDDHIIAQHVFRTPALIASSSNKQLIIIPDLDILKKERTPEWYMDMDVPENKLTLGISRYGVKEHVLFVRKPGAQYAPGKIEYGFYIMTSKDKEAIFNPWRNVLSFYWKKWGRPLYQSGEPLFNDDLESYVQQTYEWAFDSWKKTVWQEYKVDGKIVGAPVFIVNVTQSPNYKGEPREREFRSIWNQAWFSSLRSAQGLYRYARRMKDSSLIQYALRTRELALSMPQVNGFFYSVIATEVNAGDSSIPGELKPHYFGNSNRNPYTGDPRESPFHILDMSYTAFLMLNWYSELEKDDRLLEYAARYADALIGIQSKDGFFPGWLSLDSLQPMNHLNMSPESSMSVTFLLRMYEITKQKKYLKSALKAMDAIMSAVIPGGQWEDFETYWSCSRYGSEDLVGKKVMRNDMYKQNTLSMYYTAQALYELNKLTGKKIYLKYGLRTLDELLMAQSSWQPPFIYIHALGGFGVMNADGEWNDSRQSLLAELIVQYGKLTSNTEYVERGLAALRASFVMMYTPLNPETKEQWEKRWNFFGAADYGFMMENYGHGGETSRQGLGIGEFTIYDWGNGAAAETYNRMRDHYGENFLKEK